MQKDTKVLSEILILKRNFDRDWGPDLERINIKDEVSDLYNEFTDFRTPNIILTFIVLAYDASSEFIEINRDRIENKQALMLKLAGPHWKTKEIFVETVLGDDGGIVDKTIEWYITRQKDWRWGNILSGTEFHSRAQAMANSASSIKEMNEVANMLETAEKRLEKSHFYLDQIRKEFSGMDEALEKEDRVKITERLNNDESSWELFVLKRNNKEKREAEAAAKLEQGID